MEELTREQVEERLRKLRSRRARTRQKETELEQQLLDIAARERAAKEAHILELGEKLEGLSTGMVIKFSRSFSGSPKEYDYVAIKVSGARAAADVYGADIVRATMSTIYELHPAANVSKWYLTNDGRMPAKSSAELAAFIGYGPVVFLMDEVSAL